MMNIDNKTKARFVYITISKNEKYLKKLEDRAVKEGLSKAHRNLKITLDDHVYIPQELYYDTRDNELTIYANLRCKDMDCGTFIGIGIPLSDAVILDILKATLERIKK